MFVLADDQQQYVDRALALRPPQDLKLTIMLITEFINETGFNISKLYIDRFWASVHSRQMIYIDDELLRWMGYIAMHARDRKAHFLNMLREQGIDYVECNSAEYEERFVRDRSRTTVYPPVPTGRGLGKLKHILLDADSFKMAAMSVGNGHGKHVKEYYVTVEKLVTIYTQYQLQFDQVRRGIEQQRLLTLEHESNSVKQELENSKSLIEVFHRELAARDQLLANKELELVDRERMLADRERELENTRVVNMDLLAYKLDLERNETVYIITSERYADQGLFKVGRSGSLNAKDRLNSLNTAHAPGDSLFIAAEFKTNNAKQLESRAHDLMKHHRVSGHREWFHLPYMMIHRVLDHLSSGLDGDQDIMNELTRSLHEISCINPLKIKWREGLTKRICAPPVTAPPVETQHDQADDRGDDIVEPAANDQVIQFTFSVKGWSAERTREFIESVLGGYDEYRGAKKPSWDTLKKYLMGHIKPHCSRPKLDKGYVEIVQLCKVNNIML